MKADILIAENISGAAVDDLKARHTVTFEPELWRDPARLKELVAGHRALIVRNQTKVTPEVIAAGAALEVIGRAGAGLDNINVPAATAAGIVVASTPDQNSISVAELTLAMMLALARRLPAADQHAKAGGWARQQFVGTELYGKTFGVVGLGRIGLLTALRARALGMRIVAHDAYISPDAVAVTETGAELVALEELLGRADFVSCHVPLTPGTTHFFNYERFCQMRPTAFFLNLARGEVVDEAGLVRALREKRLAGAGLDVREQEPPVAGELETFDNVILTPHVAAFTREAQTRVVAAVCADVTAVLAGGAARNAVSLSKPKK